MPISPATWSNGDALTAALINAELGKVRTWANAGMVIADVPLASIPADKVFRPDAFGYPKQAVETVVQQLGGDEYGLDEPSRGVTYADASRETSRDSIFPAVGVIPGDDAFRVPHAADRIVLTKQGDVNVRVHCNVVPAYNNVASPPAYPSTFGQLVVCYSLAGPGETKTTIAHSARRLNIGQNTFFASNHINMGASVEDLAAGTYDFWVEYRRNGAASSIPQVIVSTRAFIVEVQE